MQTQINRALSPPVIYRMQQFMGTFCRRMSVLWWFSLLCVYVSVCGSVWCVSVHLSVWNIVYILVHAWWVKTDRTRRRGVKLHFPYTHITAYQAGINDRGFIHFACSKRTIEKCNAKWENSMHAAGPRSSAPISQPEHTLTHTGTHTNYIEKYCRNFWANFSRIHKRIE